MISVAEAQSLCLALATPMATEEVALADANGRVMVVPAATTRAQPPFRSAAMDGYAVRDAEVRIGASFTVVGESAAGHGWNQTLEAGQAVRIFTGAPVPEGADHVVIQEDILRDGDKITIQPNLGDGPNIRPLGVDFAADFTLSAPRRLKSADLALLAAMNVPTVTVSRKPRVAFLATGDELVMPGQTPTDDQIIASNVYALKAMVEDAGGEGIILPIAPDTEDGLRTAMTNLFQYDVAVTIGGASVGDYDLVGKIGGELGLNRSFYKIAMRPGKPLIAGDFQGRPYLGLPGNPVSAIVCGIMFLIPLVRKLQGLSDVLPETTPARLAADIGKNGPREHYERGSLKNGAVTAARSQDSSLLSILVQSNCLIVRPPNDPPRKAGEMVEVIAL